MVVGVGETLKRFDVSVTGDEHHALILLRAKRHRDDGGRVLIGQAEHDLQIASAHGGAEDTPVPEAGSYRDWFVQHGSHIRDGDPLAAHSEERMFAVEDARGGDRFANDR